MLFSISATNVPNILTSRSSSTNKSFTRDTLPATAEYFLLAGKLYHSYAGSAEIRYGICYYYAAGGYYIEAYSDEITHNTDIRDRLNVHEWLPYGYTYYTYIKNIESGGYAHGDLALYYSAE